MRFCYNDNGWEAACKIYKFVYFFFIWLTKRFRAIWWWWCGCHSGCYFTKSGHIYWINRTLFSSTKMQWSTATETTTTSAETTTAASELQLRQYQQNPRKKQPRLDFIRFIRILYGIMKSCYTNSSNKATNRIVKISIGYFSSTPTACLLKRNA